jgi:Fic family protein
MRRFDYSFIKSLKIQTDIVTVTNLITEFKKDEEKRKESFPDAFKALESIARVQSVKGSNAIEGIITTDERIRAIVNGNSAPLNHDEMEIAGYRDVLDYVHNNYAEMELNEKTILEMHRMMMALSIQDKGIYKKTDNVIVEVDQYGQSRVRFTPTSAKETPYAMEQFILAYMGAKDDSGIDPMFLIPCVILDFLCIHPFADGNGRMSRLLTLLLMYKYGIDVGKYISFEEQINRTKGQYYESLKRSSQGWDTNASDYLPFMNNFIFTLFSCYRELDRRFTVVGDKKPDKGNRIEAVIRSNHVPISKKEIGELLPDISPTTIEAKLSELQKDGKIKKIGSYKDALYFRK